MLLKHRDSNGDGQKKSETTWLKSRRKVRVDRQTQADVDLPWNCVEQFVIDCFVCSRRSRKITVTMAHACRYGRDLCCLPSAPSKPCCSALLPCPSQCEARAASAQCQVAGARLAGSFPAPCRQDQTSKGDGASNMIRGGLGLATGLPGR